MPFMLEQQQSIQHFLTPSTAYDPTTDSEPESQDANNLLPLCSGSSPLVLEQHLKLFVLLPCSSPARFQDGDTGSSLDM